MLVKIEMIVETADFEETPLQNEFETLIVDIDPNAKLLTFEAREVKGGAVVAHFLRQSEIM